MAMSYTNPMPAAGPSPTPVARVKFSKVLDRDPEQITTLWRKSQLNVEEPQRVQRCYKGMARAGTQGGRDGWEVLQTRQKKRWAQHVTDYGTLTRVFAPQWGLQVLFPSGLNGENHEWQWVEPQPGCAVINVTEALHFLTGRQLISAVHRVLPLPDEDRYSVTYFLRPSDDASIMDAEGNVINVMDWYKNKNKNYEA
ncbi:hypothetical protein HD806DRAFT_520702 [Xylariaceae sp. AK1471]|nr:hypothetical protein HD806DRAFT_520702 [Xylariaceae sp. AK1471]